MVQGYTDHERNLLINNIPHLGQQSIRLLLVINAIFCFRFGIQDVSQSYLDSSHKLSPDAFFKAPVEFQLRSDQLLQLLKPLYGLTDSAYYWGYTFSRHWREYFNMWPTAGDPSLYRQCMIRELSEMVCTYVNDTLSTGNTSFDSRSALTQSLFQSSPVYITT